MGRCTLAFIVALVSLHASSARGVAYFWTNSNGGVFDEPSNWTPFAPPATQGPGGLTDSTHFDLGMAAANRYVVSDAGRSNDRLVVHDDALELTIFVRHSLVSPAGDDPSLVVGAANGDVGDLILSSGGVSVLETQVTRIANAAGSTGVVKVDGLEWNGGNLRVGYGGDGELRIEFDSEVTSTNASLGHLAGATGAADVVGDWGVADELLVGREGSGTITIYSAATLMCGNCTLGSEPTGEGTANVGSGVWTISNSLTVGSTGTGFVSIGTNGAVINDDAFIGRLAGSEGEVRVLTGSDWTTNGRLSIGGDAATGVGGGAGVVEISGGDTTIAEDIVLFPSGRISFDGGSLDAPIITVEAGGLFDWTGGNLFVDTFQGSLANHGGTLAARSNSILVSGEYFQGSDGVLAIEIAGSAASGDYDRVTVGNTAFLGGVLDIQLPDDFHPHPNDVYTVLDALNLGAGSFSNGANGDRVYLQLSRGSFVVHYGAGSAFDPSQVVLTDYRPPENADFDEDGDVDGDDLELWQGGFGVAGSALHTQGDADGDLDVDGQDYLIWQRAVVAPPASPVIASVPEPASLALSVLGEILAIVAKTDMISGRKRQL